MKAWLIWAALFCIASVGLGQEPLVPPEGVLAFPKDVAGISAYVKIDTPIRIDEALTKIFHRIEDVSDNHILGTVEISHFVGEVYPQVYIDTEGWMVAFFPAAEPAALVMHWSGDHNNPTAFIKTTLEVALEKAAVAARVPLPKPSFYDFSNPNANAMLILLRLLPVPDTKVMYVKLPANYTLYTVSYYFYGCNYDTRYGWQWFCAELKLNGMVISRLEGRETLRAEAKTIPSRDFVPNKLHELQISLSQREGDNGSAGVVLVLIYQAP